MLETGSRILNCLPILLTCFRPDLERRTRAHPARHMAVQQERATQPGAARPQLTMPRQHRGREVQRQPGVPHLRHTQVARRRRMAVLPGAVNRQRTTEVPAQTSTAVAHQSRPPTPHGSPPRPRISKTLRQPPEDRHGTRSSLSTRHMPLRLRRLRKLRTRLRRRPPLSVMPGTATTLHRRPLLLRRRMRLRRPLLQEMTAGTD